MGNLFKYIFSFYYMNNLYPKGHEKVTRKRTIFLLILALILISFQYDNQIVKVVSEIESNLLDNFFSWITLFSSKWIVFLFLTGLFFIYKKKREWILPLWFTLFVSVFIGFVLKYFVQRPRPFQQGIISISSALEQANYLTWNFSFPSFHTLLVFSAIPLLSKEFPKLKKYWLIFAVLVGFSRVYFGLHFLSDVLVGGLIGYFIGVWVIRLERERGLCRNVWKKLFSKKN